MDNLPKDVAIEMALNFSPADLIKFCLSSKIQNRVCNSDDFWRRKIHRDYPGEFAPGVIIGNPKEMYIKRFTYISRKIEEFIEQIMKEIFPKNFSRFLNKEYKKELYDRLYELYEMIKNDEYKEEYGYLYRYEYQIVEKLSDYIPDKNMSGYESISVQVERFINNLNENLKENKNK